MRDLKTLKRQRRHARVRAKVFGTTERPRLSVFKSNKQIYAQIIDDTKSSTIACADSMKMKDAKLLEKGQMVGRAIAEKAKKVGVDKVVFDRGGFQYTGVIETFAESARKGGLTF